MAYDPTYAYEVAVIIRDGLRRMYADQEDVFFYVTLMNENYAQPDLPAEAHEGVIRGGYRFGGYGEAKGAPRVTLLGSGAILTEHAGITKVVCLLAEVCYGRADAKRAGELTSAEAWDDWALALDATLVREAVLV